MEITIFCAKAMIVLLILMVLAYFIYSLYVKAKSNTHDIEVSDFSTLLEILMAMINVELQLYENEIFSDRQGITNSNFTNFYTDICTSIEQHISPDFMKAITIFVTEDFVYTLIARKVKAYLVSKAE